MFCSLLRTTRLTNDIASVSRALSSSQRTKLAYEWVIDGKVIPATENYAVCNMLGDREVIVFLHGLLGNGKNLRTPAKKLTEQLPHLSALSLDIRGHGNSPSHSAPHTFQSCTRDVFETLEVLGLTQKKSPVAICGHSLGGRIALQYAYDLTRQSASLGIQPPRQTWILDSVPGTPDPSVHSVIKAISSIPLPISSKSNLTKTLINEHGFNRTIGMWMASNLKPTDGGFQWIFDLDVANELLSNFASQNFRDLIRHVVTGKEVHLVMAGRNREWTEEIVNSLKSIPRDSVEMFQLHSLKNAGHWVHVDDLEGLLELMIKALTKSKEYAPVIR